MDKNLEIVSYGATIVDFLPNQPGRRLRDVEVFTKTTGGAPANVAVGLARLGRRVGLICNVGDDEFGHFLREELAREHVDVSGIQFTNEAKTAVVFISLDAHGERSFLFLRHPSADGTITPEDVNVETIQRAAIFVVGSNLLIREPAQSATYFALDTAKEAGLLITADPNLRLHLWNDFDEARKHAMRLIEYADIVKLNEDELEFLAGERTAREFFEQECRPRNAAVLVITRAKHGAQVYCGDLLAEVAAPAVKVVDTTGAGDGFVAGFLTAMSKTFEEEGITLSGELIRERIKTWDLATWRRVLEVGSYMGSTVCTQFGATPALPHHDDIPWTELGF